MKKVMNKTIFENMIRKLTISCFSILQIGFAQNAIAAESCNSLFENILQIRPASMIGISIAKSANENSFDEYVQIVNRFFDNPSGHQQDVLKRQLELGFTPGKQILNLEINPKLGEQNSVLAYTIPRGEYLANARRYEKMWDARFNPNSYRDDVGSAGVEPGFTTVGGSDSRWEKEEFKKKHGYLIENGVIEINLFQKEFLYGFKRALEILGLPEKSKVLEPIIFDQRVNIKILTEYTKNQQFNGLVREELLKNSVFVEWLRNNLRDGNNPDIEIEYGKVEHQMAYLPDAAFGVKVYIWQDGKRYKAHFVEGRSSGWFHYYYTSDGLEPKFNIVDANRRALHLAFSAAANRFINL